jgi:outer membrane receptor for ferrienterochelin and colicin
MFLAALAVAGVASTVCARESEQDSIQVEELRELVVKAVSAPKDAPFAVSRIGKIELQEFSTGAQELPYLFSRTPGVMAWSENGLGTGTVYMRMRGSAGSRVNVTLDGVPLNSPEDQCVFWANMNSYATGTLVALERGEYTYQWFDPRTGEYLPEKPFQADQHRCWKVENKPTTQDWVLLIKKR